FKPVYDSPLVDVDGFCAFLYRHIEFLKLLIFLLAGFANLIPSGPVKDICALRHLARAYWRRLEGRSEGRNGGLHGSRRRGAHGSASPVFLGSLVSRVGRAEFLGGNG